MRPPGSSSLPEAVRAGAEVYARLKARVATDGFATGLGDQSGFVPDLTRPEDVLTTLVAAITDAGCPPAAAATPSRLDPAASEFYCDGAYHVAGHALSTGDLVELYADLVGRFPVWSIEDALAEDDWNGWRTLTERLGERA